MVSGVGPEGLPVYVDSSGNLVWVDNSGTTQVIGEESPITVKKSYGFQSPTGSSGTFFLGGFYLTQAADANLTQASATATIGSANISYAAHAFIVAGGVGSVSGGSTGTALITVSGTSITDAGVRTAADTEVIVSDVTSSTQMAANTYLETAKKWIGQVTFTLSTDGDRTTYNADFNLGLAKYEDFGNKAFTVREFEVTGLGSAADTGFNLILVEHSAANWTYSAAAFAVPTGNAIVNMNTDHNTEINLANGQPFAYKRSGLSASIDGTLSIPTATSSNGVIIYVVTGANGSVQSLNAHIGVTYDA